jgi:hypothetical protein
MPISSASVTRPGVIRISILLKGLPFVPVKTAGTHTVFAPNTSSRLLVAPCTRAARPMKNSTISGFSGIFL